MKRKLLSLMLTFTVAATVFMGCGSTTDNKEATEANVSSPASDENFPITIQHAFGETTIESKPERIVTLSWANQDAILALGVVPVVIACLVAVVVA